MFNLKKICTGLLIFVILTHLPQAVASEITKIPGGPSIEINAEEQKINNSSPIHTSSISLATLSNEKLSPDYIPALQGQHNPQPAQEQNQPCFNKLLAASTVVIFFGLLGGIVYWRVYHTLNCSPEKNINSEDFFHCEAVSHSTGISMIPPSNSTEAVIPILNVIASSVTPQSPVAKRLTKRSMNRWLKRMVKSNDTTNLLRFLTKKAAK